MPRHKARKRFGQNFLIDDQIIGQISDIFKAPAAEHQLIEIGPGRGALTEALLQQGQTLTALELDRDLIPILQTRFSHYKTFTLHQGDALQTNFTELASGLPLRLVGNLPYNVATPLIFKLLEDIDNIIDLHFMLQWEVVARLCAQPGDQHYGQLSVVVQNLCSTNALFDVPPEAFSPAPKVQSGFISLAPRAEPLVDKQLHLLIVGRLYGIILKGCWIVGRLLRLGLILGGGLRLFLLRGMRHWLGFWGVVFLFDVLTCSSDLFF